MSEWQDISTAPKDGTLILVAYVNGDVRTQRWWDTGSNQLGHRGFGLVCAPNPARGLPTHWQPLPPPPQPATTTFNKEP